MTTYFMGGKEIRLSDIQDLFGGRALNGEGPYAIAFALLVSADKLSEIGTHLKYLGNGNAGTTMGAIEGHGMLVGQKLTELSDSISEAATALSGIASAIEKPNGSEP